MSASQDVAEQIAKNAPVSAVTIGAWLLSVPLERWLTLALLVYTVLQIYVIVRDRVYRPRKLEKTSAESTDPNDASGREHR